MARKSFARSKGFFVRGTAALVVAGVALIASVARQHPDWFSSPSPAPSATQNNSHAYRVVKFVDGDTFHVKRDGEEKLTIRLQGVDTPETVRQNYPVQPWGPEASDFTKKFLADHEVRLEFDVELRDKYGRRLAYAWVGDRMLNEELLRAGLAHAELQYRYSAVMKERFRRAEAEAKAARRGIWSSSG